MAADLVNGQQFRGTVLPYLPVYTSRLEIWTGGSGQDAVGRVGDIPAFQVLAPDGLAVLVYESAYARVTYDDWDTFAGFVAHKDLGVTAASHADAGFPETGFTEAYRRFSKALVAGGDGAGADVAVGMEFELVAQANPYTDPLAEGLPVLLLYRDAPRGDTQIEVFDRAPDGTIGISTLRTGADGTARVPVTPGHVYMLDAVLLRDPVGTIPLTIDPAYETLWANLTFAVPGD